MVLFRTTVTVASKEIKTNQQDLKKKNTNYIVYLQYARVARSSKAPSYYLVPRLEPRASRQRLSNTYSLDSCRPAGLHCLISIQQLYTWGLTCNTGGYGVIGWHLGVKHATLTVLTSQHDHKFRQYIGKDVGLHLANQRTTVHNRTSSPQISILCFELMSIGADRKRYRGSLVASRNWTTVSNCCSLQEFNFWSYAIFASPIFQLGSGFCCVQLLALQHGFMITTNLNITIATYIDFLNEVNVWIVKSSKVFVVSKTIMAICVHQIG